MSARDDAIFELTVTGDFVRRHDLLTTLSPPAVAPQGLAFGPSSSDQDALALYIVDGGLDNGTRPDERDGFVYEVALTRVN